MAETFRLAPQEFDPAIPVAQIKEHPKNPNKGDTAAIGKSLAAHGYYGAILVQKSTGYALRGNHTYRQSVAAGALTLPGFWLDVDDAEAARIMLDDNHAARLGLDDDTLLAALLTELDEDGALPATYTVDDLDDVLARAGQVDEAPGPDGAHWAEGDDELEQRRGTIEGYADRKQGGDLVEIILVFTQDERAEIGRIVDQARKAASAPEMRAAEVVLAALRHYARETLEMGDDAAG